MNGNMAESYGIPLEGGGIVLIFKIQSSNIIALHTATVHPGTPAIRTTHQEDCDPEVYYGGVATSTIYNH